MGPLKASLAGLALALSAPGGAEPLHRFDAHIAEASLRFGIPVEWIERVIRAESGGRTVLGGQPIRSHAGAMGLMQLMPGTWRELRAELVLGSDPHDPRDNILAGTAYLREMYDRFGYPGLFAAYNAGPRRYGDYLAGRASLPAETRAYLAATAGSSAPRRRAPVEGRSAPPTPPIFIVLSGDPARTAETEPSDPERGGASGLFHVLPGHSGIMRR